MVKELKTNIGKSVTNAKLAVNKKRPEIDLISGVVLTVLAVGATIYAVKKTEKVIVDHKKRMEAVEDLYLNGIPDEETNTVKPVSEKEYKVMKVVTYGKTAWELFKCWAPAATCLGGSIATQIDGYKVLNGRYVGALASLAATNADFKHYRGNVVKDLGSEMDEKFMYDVVDKVVETEEVDEKGKKHTKKKTFKIPTRPGKYDEIFCQKNESEGSELWEKVHYDALIPLRSALLACAYKQLTQGFISYPDIRKEFKFCPTTALEAGIIDDNTLPDSARFLQIKGFGDVRISSAGELYVEEKLSDEWIAWLNGYTDDIVLRFDNIQDNIKEDLSRFVPTIKVQ